MISWALVLHFYQPPTQNLSLTQQILESCYLPLLDLLLAHPQDHFSLNISGSLFEKLSKEDFRQKLIELHRRGQIELLNSPVYHSLLPIIPADEATIQLNLNREIIRKNLGFEPVAGIFPPELAVSPDIVNYLKDTADFILVDESSVPKNSGKLIVSSRLATEIIRSYPTELSGEKVINFLNRKLITTHLPLVSVSDAEIFGHHYQERIYLLADLLNSKKIRFISLSEALTSYPLPTVSYPLTASTWQTSPEDLKNSNPFSLWLAPDNPLQQKYYDLTKTAYGLVKNAQANEDLYRRGLSSCYFYWLSNRPWWHPDLVESGASLLAHCFRSAKVDNTRKIGLENYYHSFIKELWNYHWSGKVEENYKKYELERTNFLQKLPEI